LGGSNKRQTKEVRNNDGITRGIKIELNGFELDPTTVKITKTQTNESKKTAKTQTYERRTYTHEVINE
jgi:hypothetical protein